jgi:putative cardiolipin synthase
MRTAAAQLLLLASLCLGGCAALPPRAPTPAVTARTDVDDTRLARVAAASIPADKRSLSGFRLLPEGETAFMARVALARRAEKSLDVQYYLVNRDEIGLQFLRELRDAAQRGVRVRLIVDDLYAAGEDELFAGLAAHPNVQVRIFNPLPARAGGFHTRLLFSLHEFGRINHRMHNKLLIADNSIAVSGGRNIANEYFMRSAAANFIDLDVLSTGPVVRELSRVFDLYWNSEQLYPIGDLAAPAASPEAARQRLDALVRDADPQVTERPRDVLGATPVAEQLDAGSLSQAYAAARVFADTPDKVAGRNDGSHTVTEQTLALFAAARDEVSIASPYFIPGERGLAMMRAGGATQENGRISLVTNSLGSTDEPLVHASYARYRLDMLKAGVRIWELSPSLSQRSGKLGNFGRSIGRLHAKAAVIDRRLVFIGSMNLDPRSSRINTEVGLAIESEELARTIGTLTREGLATGAYRLRLSADGEHVEWIENGPDGSTVVHTDEPDASGWVRFKQWLLAPFVSDDLL